MAGNYVRDETPLWVPTKKQIRLACAKLRAAHLQDKLDEVKRGTGPVATEASRQPVNESQRWNRRPYSTS